MDLTRVLDGSYEITLKVIGHITRKSGLIWDQWSKYVDGQCEGYFWFTDWFVLKANSSLQELTVHKRKGGV